MIMLGLFDITNPDGTTLHDLFADVVIEESHMDDLDITDHPIETGASISDHAYKLPAEVIVKMGWSNSIAPDDGTVSSPRYFDSGNVQPGAVSTSNVDQMEAIYQQLLQIQANRALFNLRTTKRLYTQMICKGLTTQNDFKTANSLFVTLTAKQVFLVNMQTVMLPASIQANASQTASPVNTGTKQLQPVGSK